MLNCNYYSKTSLNRPTVGLTLNGPFREVIGLGSFEYHYNGIVWVIVWDPNKASAIGEWSICGGGQLERFYCTIGGCHWCYRIGCVTKCIDVTSPTSSWSFIV